MARYIDKIIQGDEQVIAVANVHWIIFVWPIILAFFTMGISLVFLIFPLMYKLNSDFAVTNKRLIAKWGFINRTSIEQRIGKIESILINQGIIGRLLNYGKLEVRGTGVTGTPFGPISDPLTFKRAIEDAVERSEAKK